VDGNRRVVPLKEFRGQRPLDFLERLYWGKNLARRRIAVPLNLEPGVPPMLPKCVDQPGELMERDAQHCCYVRSTE
jgi:hypothetical protein